MQSAIKLRSLVYNKCKNYEDGMFYNSTDIVTVDYVQERHAVMSKFILNLFLFVTIDNIQPHMHNLFTTIFLNHKQMIHSLYFLNPNIIIQLTNLISLLIILPQLFLNHTTIFL